MKRMSLLMLACLCGLLIVAANVEATTYVFGEDGLIQDLTNYGSTWTSSDTYIIAGDCYVYGGDTLTIQSGVTVYFDYDYDGDYLDYPTINVEGSLFSTGTAISPVTFTNYSGTNKGEFEGLKVNGYGSTKEGVLDCDYTEFYFGGKTAGLITVIDDATIDLDDCNIKFSDNDGIQFKGDGGYAHFDYCNIDSCDDDGIGWDGAVGDQIDSLRAVNCSFRNNGDRGADMPPLELCLYAENDMFQGGNIGADFMPGDNDDPDLTMKNCIFCNSVQFGLRARDNGAAQYNGIIKNCAFFNIGVGGSGTAIKIEDMLDATSLIIERNTFIDINVNAVWVAAPNGWIWPWPMILDDIWPGVFEMDYNIFISCGTGIYFSEADGNPDVPANNAFKSANCDGVDFSGCVRHNVNDAEVNLYEEDPANWWDYDLHILWDGANTLINADNAEEDEDGSDGDYGIYGGTCGALWDDTRDLITIDDGYYVVLGDGDIADNCTIEKSWYYLYDDFVVPDNDYIINAGAKFFVQDDDVCFEIEGDLTANGTQQDTIRFCDGSNANGFGGDGWEGLYFLISSTAELSFLEVAGAQGLYPGIEFMASSGVVMEDCFLHHNTIGCEIDGGSVVSMSDTEISHNDDHGLYIDDCDAGDVDLQDLSVHHNDDDLLTSAGIYVQEGCPEIDDEANEESEFDNNDRYGLYCEVDGAPDFTGFGNSQIRANASSAIFCEVEDNPFDYGFPQLNGGHNDIEPANGQWAIELEDDLGLIVVLCWNNWWGADDVDEEDVCNEPDNIGIIPLDDEENNETVNDVENFITGKSLFDEGNYESAIEYFEDAIFTDDFWYSKLALHYLRALYKRADMDLDDLRDFYAAAVNNLENPTLIFLAGRESTLTYKMAGQYEDYIDVLEDRRDDFDNPVDSLKNEIDLLEVRCELARGNQRHGNVDNVENLMSDLQDLKKIRKELTMNGLVNSTFPVSMGLQSVYPNPFNSSTRIFFNLPQNSHASVKIYDAKGREVTNLLQGYQDAGSHHVTWNAEGFCSGVYFVKLNTPEGTSIRTINLVK